MLTDAYSLAKLAGWQGHRLAGRPPPRLVPSGKEQREMFNPQFGMTEGLIPIPAPRHDQARQNGPLPGRPPSLGSLPSTPGQDDEPRGPKTLKRLPWALCGLSLAPHLISWSCCCCCLLRQGKPCLCPAGWGTSHPDKEFDSSNPVVRQTEGGSRQRAGAGRGPTLAGLLRCGQSGHGGPLQRPLRPKRQCPVWQK